MPAVDSFSCDSNGGLRVDGGFTESDYYRGGTWSFGYWFKFDDATPASEARSVALAVENNAGSSQNHVLCHRPQTDGTTDFEEFFTDRAAFAEVLTDATWYCMMGTVSSSSLTLRLYEEDGTFIEEETGTLAGSNPASGIEHVFGCFYNNNANSYQNGINGDMALVTMWPDNALSTTEMNDFAADPLNEVVNLGYAVDVQCYESDGTIDETGGTVTNNGDASDGTIFGGSAISSGGGPDVPAATTTVTHYYAIYTDGNGGSATDANVKAGTGTGVVTSGNQADVDLDVAQSFTATGLTASTDYDLEWVINDGSTDVRASTTNFTTKAATGTVTVLTPPPVVRH